MPDAIGMGIVSGAHGDGGRCWSTVDGSGYSPHP